jgi:dTMP kinase
MAESGQGRFITFEGGEGAGKSTQVGRLAAALALAGLSVVSTREPGGSPGAEEIRRLLIQGEVGRWDPITELLLHFAARRDHVERTIRPALEAGKWVVSDRFADSTLAYQGYGLGLGRRAVERVRKAAIGDFAPDLTFILDLPAAAGLARAGRRDAKTGVQNRYERMDESFHQRLCDAYRDIARREPERCVLIDATASPEAVQAAIFVQVSRRFGVKFSEGDP